MKKIRFGVTSFVAAVAVTVVFLCVGCNDSGIRSGDGEAVEFLNRLSGGASGGSGNGSGTFRDSRDGKTYRKVNIGGQTWMAENLNYKTPSGSWCYGNEISNCNTYGRLYDWNTAMTVCPTGWHLPTREEWGDLAIVAGGNGNYGVGGMAGMKLKSERGWFNDGNGTDAYGFSAMPGGHRGPGGYFNGAGSGGLWWSATEDDSVNAYYRDVYYDIDNLYESHNVKNHGFSVRCVMNS